MSEAGCTLWRSLRSLVLDVLIVNDWYGMSIDRGVVTS
jgi:hypothetical protein